MFTFFPLLNDRFMRWIKWGAFVYLFFMGMVMITMLFIPAHRLFGLSAMHFVYLGTFFDVVFFSLAMSYKIKDSFYKVTEVKNRLSKDLHDDIGASLSSIQIYSSVAEKAINEDIERTKSILKQIRQNAGKVMEDMNDIVWAMSTDQKDEMSFSGRIKNYGYELLSQKNIDCMYRIDMKAEQKLMKPESRKNILLIVKEALNNIAKYSEAMHADVYIGIQKNDLLVMITDNGKGFSVKHVVKGNGLNNISQRTALLGGTVEITSGPGEGTAIRCVIPLTSISDNL
jgi:signal transduction histidine kinase